MGNPITAEDPNSFGDASTVAWLQRAAAVVERSQLEPGRQAVCPAEGRGREWPKALPWRKPEDHGHIPGTEWGGVYTCEVWFCFGLIVTVLSS